MTYDEIYERLDGVFRRVFDDNRITVYPETTASDVPGWDSLNHITLISAVEREFGVRFTMGEVSTMKDVGEMAELIFARAQEPKKKKKRFF